MDTNWKKSKLVWRILCGWLTVLFLLGAAASLTFMGPDTLLANNPDGLADLLNGQITGLPAFQQQMARAFYNGILTSVGGKGFSAEQNVQLRAGALHEVTHPAGESPALSEENYLYYILQPDGSVFTNTSLALYSEGQTAAPLGYTIVLAATNGQLWGNKALLAAYNTYLQKQSIEPASLDLPQGVVVFAIKNSPTPEGFVCAVHLQTALARRALICLLLCLGGALLTGLLCLCWYKRTTPARRWAASLTGKLPLEIKLIVWAAALLTIWSARPAGIIFPLLALYAAALCWPLFWLSAVDLAYNKGMVFRHSIIVQGLRVIRSAAQLALRGQPWQRRILLSLLLCWLGSCAAGIITIGALFMGALTPFILGAVFSIGLLLVGLRLLFVWLRDTGRLTDKINQLRLGQATEPLQLASGSPLAGPAADLNALEEGVACAVEERSRADRMKVELVTNVSHDLKTPLTSIINYADLLCAEPLEGAAADYARVIQQKADRLKAMVQDVFDLSKATSGNLPMAPKPIDLAKLLRQTLADMDEAIAASPLTFKENLPPEAWVQADGDRLYRVFQNLFTNALQYSLPGSRVYVELKTENGQAAASVKNVARYEMEFDPGEITERFTRGDAARTGEGSGLGLSIAKSFTEACGGEFYVRADADLFSATVLLQLTEKPAEQIEPSPPPDLPPAAETAAGAGAL